jgi:hypothetical protein
LEERKALWRASGVGSGVVFFNLKEKIILIKRVKLRGVVSVLVDFCFFFVVWIIRNKKKIFAIGKKKNKNWRLGYVELLFFVIAYGG